MSDQNFNDEAPAEEKSAKIDETKTRRSNDQVIVLALISSASF